jgi:hypothetical protein
LTGELTFDFGGTKIGTRLQASLHFKGILKTPPPDPASLNSMSPEESISIPVGELGRPDLMTVGVHMLLQSEGMRKIVPSVADDDEEEEEERSATMISPEE